MQGMGVFRLIPKQRSSGFSLSLYSREKLLEKLEKGRKASLKKRRMTDKKRYYFLSPSNEFFMIADGIEGLTLFCKEHSLSYDNMLGLSSGRILEYKGWKKSA